MHIGRKWPMAEGRDLWINGNNVQFGIHRNWRWRGIGTMLGTLGAGWGQNLVSEDGVVDYDVGEVDWVWLPPPGANALLRYHLIMYLNDQPPFITNRFWVRLSYDGTFGPKFDATISTYTADHYILNCGGPFIIVPGVGNASSSVVALEGMRWTDY